MSAILWIQLLLHFMAHAQIELFSPCTFLQIVSARRVSDMNIVQIHLAVMQPLTQRTASPRFVHFLPGFPHALQCARRIFCGRGRHRVFVTFHADDIRHQHGMVRSHRTTRFGDYRRMRQAIFFTGIANRPDDVVGVFIEAIVHRTIGL